MRLNLIYGKKAVSQERAVLYIRFWNHMCTDTRTYNFRLNFRVFLVLRISKSESGLTSEAPKTMIFIMRVPT